MRATAWIPFTIGSLMLAQVGCSTTKTNRVVTGRPGAAHSGPVVVVMQGAPAPPHEEIAIVQAVGNGSHADLEHVVAGLKKEAQQLGCTGVINVKVDQGSGSASGTGVCVRILTDAPRPTAPPPVASPPPPVETAAVPEPPPAEPAPIEPDGGSAEP